MENARKPKTRSQAKTCKAERREKIRRQRRKRRRKQNKLPPGRNIRAVSLFLVLCCLEATKCSGENDLNRSDVSIDIIEEILDDETSIDLLYF